MLSCFLLLLLLVLIFKGRVDAGFVVAAVGIAVTLRKRRKVSLFFLPRPGQVLRVLIKRLYARV